MMECSNARVGELGRESTRRRCLRAVRLMAACGVVAALAVALPVTFISQRVEIVRVSHRRDVARARVESLRNECERLSLELARATSLEKVDQTARLELGMIDPSHLGVVMVDARPAPGGVTPALLPSDTADASRPPAVLAGLTAVVEQMVVAAVSNLVAAWFVNPPAGLPAVLE